MNAGGACAGPDEAGAGLLVCVWYKVASADAARAIAGVREFQRTLPGGVAATGAQVLLRCALPTAGLPAAGRNAPSPPADHASSDLRPSAPPDPESTLMETYRLRLPAPAGSPAAEAATHAFLRALEAAAAPLAPMVRGGRHVELFAPCAS